MNIDRWLIHTATITRPARTKGTAGEIVQGAGEVIWSGRARFYERSEREALADQSAESAFVTRLLVQKDAKAAINDTVEVSLDDDTVVGPYRIESVLRRQNLKRINHLSLILEKIGG
jgi:hypothetical protein